MLRPCGEVDSLGRFKQGRNMRCTRALSRRILSTFTAVGLVAAPSVSAAPAAQDQPIVFVGAGDIAGPWLGDDQTAELLDDIPGHVFTLARRGSRA